MRSAERTLVGFVDLEERRLICRWLLRVLDGETASDIADRVAKLTPSPQYSHSVESARFSIEWATGFERTEQLDREAESRKATEEWATANRTKVENAEPASASPTPKKAKRSTERGEGRAKLIAALTKHHKYADGGCLNSKPIGNNDLARQADVDQSTASAFFAKEFKGLDKYKATCGDAASLTAALKLLNGEFAPHHLYGSKPADEDERDEE